MKFSSYLTTQRAIIFDTLAILDINNAGNAKISSNVDEDKQC